MKILQLCNKPPYPPVDGGTMAMNSITQGLLAAGCGVRVLSLCSDKHPVLESRMTEDYLRATRFEAVHIDLGIHPLDAGVALLCGESYHVNRFVSREFSRRLAQVLDEEQFDVVHLESIFMTPYVPVIRAHSQAKVVLRAHNVEHTIWGLVAQSERNPLKRWYLKHLSLTLGSYEREHLNGSCVRWVVGNRWCRYPSELRPRWWNRWKKSPTRYSISAQWTGCPIKRG